MKRYLYNINYQRIGWINFLSGALVASSINALTTFCATDDASIFILLSFIATSISSAVLFGLYLILASILDDYSFQISTLSTLPTPSEVLVQKNLIIKHSIDNNFKKIKTHFFFSIVFCVLGIVFLVLARLL